MELELLVQARRTEQAVRERQAGHRALYAALSKGGRLSEALKALRPAASRDVLAAGAQS